MSKSTLKRIFLVGADYELDNIFVNIPLHEVDSSISPFFRFKVTEDNKNLVIITGFSKTNASAAAQFLIDHYSAQEYINLGLVGALNPKLDIGQVVQIKECRFYDVDFTAFKYKLGQLPSTDIYKYTLRQIPNLGIPEVKLISGDRFVTDKSIFSKDIIEYKPDCVEVEMTSIAHVFYINGLLSKLSSIRTISDRADNHASTDFYNDPAKLFRPTNELIKKLLA